MLFRSEAEKRGRFSALAEPLMLVRFLRARDNDVDAAAAMYESTLEWRKKIPDRKSVV